MNVLLVALLSAAGFLIAYHTYGRWLGKTLFALSLERLAPSVELEDGKDYIPTSKAVVFGHHFTSIAGTGPIVGPALAVIWGWLPALLWVLFGSIFIGAVHDFGSLVVSLRHRGKSLGEISGSLISPRTRFLFLLILFLSLTIVLAIFGLVIAAVFKAFPVSIVPCLVQIPLAICIGLIVHRRSGSLLLPSLLTLALMYLSVGLGQEGILAEMNAWLTSRSAMWWCSVLLIYSFLASVLPVWVLLQPRDYINSLQLLTTIGLVVCGLVAAALFGGASHELSEGRPPLTFAAPMIAENLGSKLPEMMPFLFITIACGAVSGFHCLVSSGTSSKQLKNEMDAQFVGYGSMLTEGFLAVIVILACVAGLGLGVQGENGPLFGQDAWLSRYESWNSAKGLAAKVGAFVDGSANLLRTLGIGDRYAQSLMGVFVASFAATTLDTACRLQRYVVQELARTGTKSASYEAPRGPLSCLQGPYGATFFGVATAFLVAFAPPAGAPWGWESAGQGGLLLWPLFGATNQLLAGLAFIVILFWLRRQNKPVWFLLAPAFFMLVLPAWALLRQLFVASIGESSSWIEQENWLLVGFASATLLLEGWIVFETIRLWKKKRE